MIVLQWDQHHVIRVVKYLKSCLPLLLQRDSCLCRPVPRRFIYHDLLPNFTSSVIFRQFMNNTHFYRHGVCIFNIAVRWYKELAQHRSMLSSTNAYEECSYQTSLVVGSFKTLLLAGKLHAKTSWNIQNNLRVIICYSRFSLYKWKQYVLAYLFYLKPVC